MCRCTLELASMDTIADTDLDGSLTSAIDHHGGNATSASFFSKDQPRRLSLDMFGTSHGGGRAIYLAGFDVFRDDAVSHGKWLVSLCRDAGFEGLYPLDVSPPSGLSGVQLAAWIYRANVELIRRADFVIANVNDFRSVGEPDSGTAFEIGFATALGKTVWGYSSSVDPLIARVPSSGTDGANRCQRGFIVEDFGLPVNLMIGCSVKIVHGGPEECLAAILAHEDGMSEHGVCRA